MVGKFFFKILSFFIFCFIVKCTDDNYVFVEFHYGNCSYEIKGNLEEKKIKIDEDFTNENFENFINKVGQKAYKDDQNFKNFLEKNTGEKIKYIIVSNTVTVKNNFYDFYNYYDFKDFCNLNDDITSKEFKIYKDFSEMINDNNYKQKTIHLMYGGYNDYDYNEYKKTIKTLKIGIPAQTIELKNGVENGVKIEDKDINMLSILKNNRGYNIFTKKINEELEKDNYKDQVINFSSDPLNTDNKKIGDFLKLGGIFECTHYDEGSEEYTVSPKYKRKIKLHFKVPKDYEIVDYFKDEIIFDMYLDNFEIRYLLQKLRDFIKTYNNLKNYTLKPYGIECHEIEDFFYTIKEDDDYHFVGIFAKKLTIKGKDKNGNNFEKTINNETEYKGLKDKDTFESKNNEIIDIEIDLGIYSELLKTDYVILNFEAPDGHVLCDRLNKKVCFPIPLQYYENDHNQCFEDQMRFLGIKSKIEGEINLKFPKDFYDLEYAGDYTKGDPIKIGDMRNFKVKLTTKTIGKYSKTSGSKDPEPYDPNNDEEYKHDKRNYTNFTPPVEDPPTEIPPTEIPPAPTPVEDKIDKDIGKLGCCAKCMSKCCCCKNKNNNKDR